VFFGILTLTWTFSGLLTMDPWGAFTSSPPVGRAEINGAPTWAETRAALERGLDAARAGELRQLSAAPLAGAAYLLATDAAGETTRLGAQGPTGPIGPAALEAALRGRGGALADVEVMLQDREDAYYYGHKTPALLPVLRADLGDAGRTALYIDPATGDVLRLVDDVSRQSRWLETGLHSFDLPGLRWRPVWDIAVMLLLAGVTAVCATGTWLAVKRVGRDLTPGVRFSRNRSQTGAE
jgi:hypothetical protein